MLHICSSPLFLHAPSAFLPTTCRKFSVCLCSCKDPHASVTAQLSLSACWLSCLGSSIVLVPICHPALCGDKWLTFPVLICASIFVPELFTSCFQLGSVRLSVRWNFSINSMSDWFEFHCSLCSSPPLHSSCCDLVFPRAASFLVFCSACRIAFSQFSDEQQFVSCCSVR